MAQQTLKTIISIGGNVDNTFGRIGGALMGLGAEIDKISQKLINFGEEALRLYADYDDDLRAIQGKIGDVTQQEMDDLDDQIRAWAETTRYHATEVAGAVKEAATSGWKLGDVYEGLPRVMNLAAAADMSLVDAMGYLNSALAGQGLELEDSEAFINQWVKTANNSRATVQNLGESMETLGSLATFTESSEELFTMLAMMAEYGTKGSEAGTLLRNVILRMVAPTDKAAAALQLLGATEEELTEIEAADLGAAAERMEELGLSAFDQHGNLRSIIDVIGDLRTAVSGMTEQEMYDVLYDIFPTRTIRGIMDLLRSTDDEYETMMATILDSDGYAKEIADLQEGGIGGALRELESRWEEFQLTIGEVLAPAVEQIADGLGSIISGLSDMDQDTLEALVSGLGIVAAAGPGLLIAGGAMRILGYLLTPAGAMGMGLVTLAAVAAYMEKIRDADMTANFGDLQLDMKTLQPYIEGLSTDFKAAYGEINTFSGAVDSAVESYQTASTQFSSDLLTLMLTQTQLTDDDKTRLQGLGTEMYTQLVSGITNATAATMSYWEMLFGGEGEAEYDPQYQDIIDLTNQSYLDALANAESISQGMRDALTSAFDDGTISQDEYAELQTWMQSYNDAMAQAATEAQSEEDYVNMQKLLRKAQTASLDEIKALAKATEEERASVLQTAEDEYLTQKFKLEYRWDRAIENGDEINGVRATEEGKQSALLSAEHQYNQHVQAQSAQYDDILLTLWESQIQQSDLAGAYDTLGNYADAYLSGAITKESASEIIGDLFGKSSYAGDTVFAWENPARQQIGEYMARIISSLGGYEGVQEKIDHYTSIGDTENAQRLARLYAMEGIATNYAHMNVASDTLFGWYDGKVVGVEGGRSGGFGSVGSFEEGLGQYAPTDYNVEIAKRAAEMFSGENGNMDEVWTSIGDAMAADNATKIQDGMLRGLEKSEFNRIIENLAANYDFEKVLAGEGSVLAEDGSAYREHVAAYSLLYGNASQNPEDYRITAEIVPEIADNAVQDAAGEQQITAEVVPEEGAAPYLDATVQLDPGADAEQYASDFNAAPIADVTAENPVTDAAAYSAVFSANANPAANVGTNSASTAGSQWQSAFEANCTPTVRIRTIGGGGGKSKLSVFAEGGRTTEPAIFGEVPGMAEWAIPEEHSFRTAELLNSARKASGFTWPELIDRTGGLGANARHTPSQLIYSPTIIANDAAGVEEKLKEDKGRLDAWWEEKQLRDERESYE